MKAIADLLLNSEQLADWLAQLFIGIAIIWLGSLISDVQLSCKPPRRLTFLIKLLRTPTTTKAGRLLVDGGVLAFQVTGLFMCLFSFYSWFANSHQQAFQFYLRGALLVFALCSLWLVICVWLNRGA